jgi:GNAT superfamily N-acetyltransferase
MDCINRRFRIGSQKPISTDASRVILNADAPAYQVIIHQKSWSISLVKIRAVEEKDSAAILALIKGKAEFDGCLDSMHATANEIAEAFFGKQPKAFALAAETDKRLVGIATYYSIYSTFISKSGIWLDDLFVYPQYRKIGIGKALIKELCVIAQKNGCGRIDWVVARDNENGRAFYRSLGANVFEEVRHSRLDEAAIKKLARQNS